MSIGQLVIVAIVLILVVPPEKLPDLMRTIARTLNDFRRSTSGVWDDIKKEAEYKPRPAQPTAFKPSTQNKNAEPIPVESFENTAKSIDEAESKEIKQTNGSS